MTQEFLKSHLSYDPISGFFTWIKPYSTACRIKIGDVAGSFTSCGYVNIVFANKQYKAHRLAWLYMTGSMPEIEIDHINGKRDDNRWCNLRHADLGEQARNKSLYKNNRTGFKGVEPWGRKWKAIVHHDKKSYYLGLFDTAHEADMAARRKREELHGEFTNHG
ncbi:MAG: HNH endonuclease [Alphaproteobacteria bacterium]|nr:HNH endonuclease [Alphaproteobacteria bacterium]